jgi:hypothetical protein
MIGPNETKVVPQIAEKIQDIFFYAVRERHKNLFIRFDLRFPDDGLAYDEPGILSAFLKLFQQDRFRSGYGKMLYLWVRERRHSEHGHVHLFILMDGNKTQYIGGHMEKAEALWNRFFHLPPDAKGLLHRRSHAEQNGIMLRRGEPEFEPRLNECLAQSFYLAKKSTKYRFEGRGRTWSCTQWVPTRTYLQVMEELGLPAQTAAIL